MKMASAGTQAAARGWSRVEAAEVLAVERENVEGVDLDLVIELAGVHGVEVSNPVDAEHHRLALDHD